MHMLPIHEVPEPRRLLLLVLRLLLPLLLLELVVVVMVPSALRWRVVVTCDCMCVCVMKRGGGLSEGVWACINGRGRWWVKYYIHTSLTAEETKKRRRPAVWRKRGLLMVGMF
jgi:hypothetical protein